MANTRSAIRAALKALLLDETDAGANVYTNRDASLWESETPAILISTSEESANPTTFRHNRYTRDLTFEIAVKVKTNDAVDDELDALIAQVETIMLNNASISGTVLGTFQTNTELRYDTEGEVAIGVGVLRFTSKYIS